jgi:hypothetical protein
MGAWGTWRKAPPPRGVKGRRGKMPITQPRSSKASPENVINPAMGEDGGGMPEPTRFGGREGARTPDLRVANAALSQLSYTPKTHAILARGFGGRRVSITALKPLPPTAAATFAPATTAGDCGP